MKALLRITVCSVLASALVSASPAMLQAQEGTQVQQVQVFGFGTGEGGAGGENIKASIGIGGPGGVTIVGGNGPAVFSTESFGLGGVNPNNNAAIFNLLSNASVAKELKLTEDQIAGAKKIMTESGTKISQVVRQAMQEGRNMRDIGLRELVQENQKASEAALEEILLPGQLKRLRQIAYQVEVAQIGLSDALTGGRLGTEVGVTDNQKQHITEKAAQIDAEMKLEIARIRAIAQAKLLGELSSEQRQKAEELMGAYFLYEEPTMAQRVRQTMKQRQEQSSGSEKSSPSK
ncbi:MAG: hypothetical protein U0892_17890 [Pirellulales bacterium]